MGHTQTAGGRDVRAKHRLTQTGGASNLGTDVVYTTFLRTRRVAINRLDFAFLRSDGERRAMGKPPECDSE